MTQDSASIRLTLGERFWSGRLRRDLAPRSCDLLERLLPYQGQVLHARWSGEALWAPLERVWPTGCVLPAENATSRPRPGEILLFGGRRSEPELLLPYGACRFASKAGRLAGNPVLSLEGPFGGLAALGEQALSTGAIDLRIERFP